MTASESPWVDPDIGPGDAGESQPAVLGDYTWVDFLREYGYEGTLPERPGGESDSKRLLKRVDSDPDERAIDWERVDFDPVPYLGFHPDRSQYRVGVANGRADSVTEAFRTWIEATPVAKDAYTWEHFKWTYYYEPDGSRPRDETDRVVPFEPEEHLGFEPEGIESVLSAAGRAGGDTDTLLDRRTVDVNPEIDEDAFFSHTDGRTTITNRYDLEKTVPMTEKTHFEEIERYWVNKPYAFVMIFHSTKENEEKYFVVDPYLDDIEDDLRSYLSGKLRTAIRYSDDRDTLDGTLEDRKRVIERETRTLLDRYNLYDDPDDERPGLLARVGTLLGDEEPAEVDDGPRNLRGIEARPEPVVLAENPDVLSEYQVEKLLYRLKRDFIGYERIDGIKHDIQVEDISCDGYDSPVFVYHTEYEQLITNVEHGRGQLDNFVVKLAQRSGKGISKRRPQVDATLPDGSRAQLTLGSEVSDHGTNYTIRQFKDVPFTPVDLINWHTFSLDQMAFLWLCIESEKSVMFGGGTASGKTTSLNAVSLFIPSNSKIVSIEDTREVELPQRNWVASVTRPSFTDDGKGDIDEFDLLEAALRQRPEYIVMGEVRGEEGRTLFQVMSTGHTTLTTFHADSVDEVLKRFTTDPINVSKTMFTALDIVSVQTQTRVDGRKVRRNRVLTDVNYYDTENDEINVQDVFEWQPRTDEFLELSSSNKLQEIKFDRGWDDARLERELFKRKVVLSYLIVEGLNEYAEVAATVQAFINDPETILTLIARGELEDRLRNLRTMQSVLIDVDPEKEALVPRPEPDSETYELAESVLSRAEDDLFEAYRDREPSALGDAIPTDEPVEPVSLDLPDDVVEAVDNVPEPSDDHPPATDDTE